MHRGVNELEMDDIGENVVYGNRAGLRLLEIVEELRVGSNRPNQCGFTLGSKQMPGFSLRVPMSIRQSGTAFYKRDVSKAAGSSKMDPNG